MLRKLTTIIILTSCVAISGTASIKSDKNRIKDREQKIEKQLSSMSLEQKIGQMVQLEVNMITQFDQRYTVTALQKLSVKELSDIISKFDLTNEYDATLMVVSNGKPKSSNDYQYQCLSQAINYKLGFKLDKTKLQNVFQTYRVGSILNMLGGTCAAEVDVWNKATNTIQEAALKYSGIPMVYGLDQLHGTTYTAKGTLFPHQIGMVATFNPELAKRMGEISAYETRACGVRWLFSPSMDICRKPSWPRLYESMGEDPTR
jgi:beta-glucosidase